MAVIQSGATGDLLTVDPTSKAARVSLYDTAGNFFGNTNGDQPTTVTGMMNMALNDGMVVPLRADRLGSLALAYHTPLFADSFEGTTINPVRWTTIATTMAATQSSTAGVTFNSGNITTVTTGYLLRSNRYFIKTQRQPNQLKFRARLDHYNNSVIELGFGDATSFNGANTTGAFWQMTSSGVLQPVVVFNSVVQTGTDVRSLISTTNYYTFDIFADDDEINFTIQDTSNGSVISKQTIRLPSTGQRLWSSSQLPVMARLYNTGVAPATAPHLFLTDVYVALLDGNINATAPQTFAMMHRDASANPFTGVQTQQFANSAEPTSATLSNTAAGYTTLGGKFQFAAVAGAATDYALFGYQVPTPSTLVVTGIEIETWNTGAAAATTPTLLTWGVHNNLTAVSLATAGGARVMLGSQVIAVGTAIGGQADRRISKQFTTPLVCGPGRFFDIILRMPVGSATASQVIAGYVNIEGYFI